MYRAYVYNKNVQQINLHNSDPTRTFEQGVNQFTDLTQEEFAATLLTVLPPPESIEVTSQLTTEEEGGEEGQEEELPVVGVTAVDHTVAKPTNPYPAAVRNQGSCGSCYAFATLSEMTMSTSMQKRVAVIYSPQ